MEDSPSTPQAMNSASGNLAAAPAANSDSNSSPQQRAAVNKLAGKKRRHDDAITWDDDKCSTYVGVILKSSSCRGPVAIPENDARQIDEAWYVRLNSWSDWLASYALGFTSYRPTGGSCLFPFLKKRLHQTRVQGALRVQEEELPGQALVVTQKKKKDRIEQSTKTFEAQAAIVVVKVPADVSAALGLAQGKAGDEELGLTTDLQVQNVLKKGKCNEVWLHVDGMPWVGRFLAEEHNAKEDRSSPGTEQDNGGVAAARTRNVVIFLPPNWIIHGPLKKCKMHVDPNDQHDCPLDEESYRVSLIISRNWSRGVN